MLHYTTALLKMTVEKSWVLMYNGEKMEEKPAMKIFEAENSEAILSQLLALSAQWESEQSCHGYVQNGPEDIEENRIFLAADGETVLGYLFGSTQITKERTAVMPAGVSCFEIGELYIRPEYRSRGIGRKLMSFAEEKLKGEGIPYLMLSTASKNYKAILHFYIEEMEMEFWYACLFKKL